MADATCCKCGDCPECGFVAEDKGAAVADPKRFAHAAIRQRLLDRIVATQIDGQRPLAKLTTRDLSDPTIALIDGWAGALHVLGWNTRRLHEDGNFHQSEDRDAMVAHARMLGYNPRPILAAQTVQSFTVDEFSGLEGPFNVPAGTKIASVPHGDELPKIFETDLPLEARRAWNRILPVRVDNPQAFTLSTPTIVIDGNAALIQIGDTLLLPDSQPVGKSVLRSRAVSVEVQQIEDGGAVQTLVGLTGTERLQNVPEAALPQSDEVIVLARRASIFGANAPDYDLVHPDDGSVVGPVALALKQSPKGVGSSRGKVVDSAGIGTTSPGLIGSGAGKSEWPNFIIAAPPSRDPREGRFDLDGEYTEATPDRIVLFDAGTTGGSVAKVGDAPRNQLGAIDASEVLNRSDFALAQKVTRVRVGTFSFEGKLSGGQLLNSRVRESSVFLETSRQKLKVPLLDESLPKAGSEDRLLLVGEHELPPGRLVTITGDDAGQPLGEAHIAEVATVLSAEIIAPDQTLVVFEGPLAQTYWSSTLGVHANCTTASHAETAGGGDWEILGSGKRGVAKPVFPLKQGPLARLPAVNERGFAPAIEVRVEGRKFEYADTLYGVGADESVFTIEPAPDGKDQIRFAGSLPSGLNNVMAFYRFGGGATGNLDAGRITTILSPVLGIVSSSNLVRAEGGMEAETLDDIRRAAPRNVAALGRVVSRADYEAFATGFRGVGKAIATRLQEGMRPVVCLTIATTDMVAPVAGSSLVSGLTSALNQATAPGQGLRIEGFEDETVTLVAALKVDETVWRRGDVEQTARLHLADRFGRESMQFGQPLRASAILAALHEVEGVVAARIETLDSDSAVTGLPDIPARLPHIDPVTGEFVESSLLSLNENSISFTEMA